METIKKIVAANVTYSGITLDTPLLIEYKHTGIYYFFKIKGSIHIFTGEESLKKYKEKKKKIFISSGYYAINRLAIPCNYDRINKNFWYINNCGDSYKINKVSKYAKKIHSELIKEEIKAL